MRYKLITGDRLAVAVTPEPVIAIYEDRQLNFPDYSLPIGQFLASGGFGMVFAHDNLVVKLEIEATPKLLEIDLTHWAGERGYGPKLEAWGKLDITRSDFDILIAEMKAKSSNLPYWLKKLDEVPFSVNYIVMERWDMDLEQWLTKQNKMLTELRPTVFEKLIEGIQQLHRLGFVHLDLLPKNILVKQNARGEVILLGMGDFGNAQLRTTLFFGGKVDFKYQLADYFITALDIEPIAEALRKFDSTLSRNSKAVVWRWLNDEPFNFDWALLHLYNLDRRSDLPIPKLRPTAFFNDNRPWSKKGFLYADVRLNGEEIVFDNIFGLWSLATLRNNIELEIPQVASKQFVSFLGNKLIPKEDEDKYNVSSVIQKKQSYFVEFR